MRTGINPLVKTGINSWSACFAALALAAMPHLCSAQVSLATVVDLAQRNSSSVKLAQSDVQKAALSLTETKDAFIPSLIFGSGLPAFPEVGFTGNLPSIWNVNIQSMVFSMPQFRYIQAARRGMQAAQLSLKDAQEQVALDAATTYIELDTVATELDAAQQQEDDANRLVTIEQQRTEAGVTRSASYSMRGLRQRSSSSSEFISNRAQQRWLSRSPCSPICLPHPSSPTTQAFRRFRQ